jgi:cytochrome c oxidase subunit 2
VRRPRRALRAAAAGLAALAGCSGAPGLPAPATEQARDIADLWRIFVVAAAAVAAVVYLLIGFSVVRFRARGREGLPPQFRQHLPLEVLYTAIPLVLVAALFVLTVRTESRVERLAARPDLTVRVTGFTWSWRFDYEGTGLSVVGTPDAPPELVLPTRRTIRFELASPDVVHSFFVPAFHFKRDVIPGFPNRFDVVLPLPGTWGGACAEFCGLDHARMTFRLRALPPEEFEAWLAARRSGAGG